MAKVMSEPVLIVSVESISIEDYWSHPHMVVTQKLGRSRLVIEGEDAIVAVLHAQAVAAAEHLRDIAGVECAESYLAKVEEE